MLSKTLYSHSVFTGGLAAGFQIGRHLSHPENMHGKMKHGIEMNNIEITTETMFSKCGV